MAKLAEYRDIWEAAAHDSAALARSLESEDAADKQLELRLRAVRLIARTPAQTQDELKLKLAVWLKEAGVNPSASSEMTAEMALLVSLFSDLGLLSSSGARNDTSVS